MAKTKLCFDATTDVDNVGAWVRAGTDGDRIGSQTYNLEEWLNVAAILTDSAGAEVGTSGNPLYVTGMNIEVDLSHLDDSVRLGDGTSFFTSTTVGADLGLDVNLINASIAVTATDLDIRNLSASQDNIAISDGTDTLAINADGSINITDNGGSLTVDATDFDIRNLTAVSDSVAAHTFDGAGNSITSYNSALAVDDTANTACSFSATSVDNTAGGTDLVATDLANRKYLNLYNNGNQTVYIGESGVTASTGFPLDPCGYLELRAGASCNLHAIGSTATAQDIRIMELS